MMDLYSFHVQSFNPRPCARGDRQAIAEAWPVQVSIHAPVQGATTWGVHPLTARKFQSTPLCKGRRARHAAACRIEPVSIHAPVQGATRALRRNRHVGLFQSTPLCKGRPRFSLPLVRRKVSIHAPVQGATVEAESIEPPN